MENTTTKETRVLQQTPTGNVETHTVTTKSPFSNFFVSKVNQVIISILTIIDILIGLRFLFLLFGANQVGIVNFIFVLTDIFVNPFKGIFPSPTSGSGYFDVASILAIIIWTILAVILGIVIDMFSTKTEV